VLASKFNTELKQEDIMYLIMSTCLQDQLSMLLIITFLILPQAPTETCHQYKFSK